MADQLSGGIRIPIVDDTSDGSLNDTFSNIQPDTSIDAYNDHVCSTAHTRNASSVNTQSPTRSIEEDSNQDAGLVPSPVSAATVNSPEPHLEAEPDIQTPVPGPASRNDSTTYLENVGRRQEAIVAVNEPESLTDHGHKPLWRIWALEIMWIVFGYAAFAVIIIVLAIFDQQQLPNWPLKVSLNTFLAFLTIAAKAAFMFPVSIAISQTQWSWFAQGKPLYDFHLLDQASRGPLGSAKLALRIRHNHFITLGALLTIFSVLTSPITQLAIDYPVREVVDSEDALVPALRTLNYSTDDPVFAANSAIVITFRTNTSLTQAKITTVVLIHTVPVFEVEGPPQDNLTHHNESAQELADTFFERIGHEAVEVMFYLCVQTYNTTVYRGVELTEMVGSVAEPVAQQDSDLRAGLDCRESSLSEYGYCVSADTSKIDQTIRLHDPDEREVIYSADFISMYKMGEELWLALWGQAKDDFFKKRLPEDALDPPGILISSNLIWNIFRFILYTPENCINGTRRYQHLHNMYQNIAATLSFKYYRAPHFSLYLETPDRRVSEGAFNITGKAFKEESYVDIAWVWISFLAVELILATLFLFLTIFGQIKDRRRQAKEDTDVPMFHNYKDNTLAPLLALSNECRAAAGGGLQPKEGMNKMAKGLMVKFQGREVVVAAGGTEGVTYDHTFKKTRHPVRSALDKLEKGWISTQVGDHWGIPGVVLDITSNAPA
ncbi:hypothetical protein QBC40DRAFT_318830 [Triangularia verruculosa]|uniref:Uncharacterized protein n=1 Tax=Triangularia verruculosa TaxID=2587418 RepID=A0AAN6XB94_9PEZI|nr:hypothetical protein QBC40DRAFT_318830 [Triangularia verruculosa]